MNTIVISEAAISHNVKEVISFVPQQTKAAIKTNSMKILGKHEMMRIKGGVYNPDDIGGHIPGLVGWELRPDGCYCDFANVASPQGISCWNPCPVSMCTEGSIDPNAPAYN